MKGDGGLSAVDRADIVDDCEFVIDKFDADDSGKLDLEEAKKALMSYYHHFKETKLDPEEAMEMVKEVDANDSGIIERPELFKFIKAEYLSRQEDGEQALFSLSSL